MNLFLATSPRIPLQSPRVWLLPLLCLVGMAWVAGNGNNQALFLALNGLAAQGPETPWAWFTALGDTLTAFCLLLALARHRPELVLAGMIAALLATFGTHVPKNVFDIPRPAAVLGDAVHVIGHVLKSGSFPSGHTVTAFTLAAVVGGFALSRRLTLGLVALAALIGFSRVAVGAHWPLDVLAGAAVGWLSGLGGLALARRVKPAWKPGIALALELLLVASALALLFSHDSGYPQAEPLERGIALAALGSYALALTRRPK